MNIVLLIAHLALLVWIMWRFEFSRPRGPYDGLL